MNTPPARFWLRPLFWFIVIWTMLNLLQAAALNVDADEAYYWLYSRQLSWGYFDHPPLVALFVRLGESLGHGSFFTRLGTVLLSAGSVYFGYRALYLPQKSPQTFLLVFASVVLFHAYGFIATPDACLLFFTTLFFFRYKEYLQQQSLANTLWLAFAITGMLYSKYHGVLPVLFVFLSNPRLALKPTAWLAVALVALAFLPHLWWQYQHNWPTFRYHLSERGSGIYKLEKTTTYLLIQLCIWGPLTTIPALYFMAKQKLQSSVYLRAHYFTFFGIFLFFLLSSFRVTIQGQWVLAAGPSFVVRLVQLINQASPQRQQFFHRLLRINVGFILLLRAVLFIPGLPWEKAEGLRAVAFGKAWAGKVHNYAAGRPVVFANSYAWPALYVYYYPQEQTIGYNTIDYRKTQFSLAQTDTVMHNLNVLLASPVKVTDSAVLVESDYTNTFLGPLQNFQAVTPLRVVWLDKKEKVQAGKTVSAAVTLIHNGSKPVDTKNLFLSSVFFRARDNKFVSTQVLPFTEASLPPGFKKTILVQLQAPEKDGSYFVIFNIVQPPFTGSFASDFYKVEVE